MSTGSSPIIYSTGAGSQGPQGTGGTGGPEGPRGNTGTGVAGNTGFGITGISLVSGNIRFIFGPNGSSGATLLFNDIRGLSGICSQLGTNSLVFFGLTGTTSSGTPFITRTIKGTLNSQSTGYSFDVIRFSNLIISSNISYLTGPNSITFTALSYNNPFGSAQNNSIAGGITLAAGVTKIEFSTNNKWLNTEKTLELSIFQKREIDVSGSTGLYDNYRKDSVGTLTTETQFRSMGITGITGPVILSKPLSTISGTTLQSALYLFDGYTTGSTNSNILWFRPLTEPVRRSIRSGGETYGSCVISNGNCIDYVNSAYCTKIGGTFFAGLTCDGNTYGKRGCCYWNINTGSYACIDARPEECQNFNGIIKNFPCSYYGVNESCLNICLPCDKP